MDGLAVFLGGSHVEIDGDFGNPLYIGFDWFLLNLFLLAMSSLPLWIQVPAMMLVADLTQYAVHRAFHVIPFLWPFHAIHHSSRAMDWLAGSRLHAVDIIVTRATIMVPLFLLGFSQNALYVWLVIVGFHAVFNHINMNVKLRWLEPFVVTPRFHHWHHAQRPWDKNFAVHFPWIDRIFGTYYMPDIHGKEAWPELLGIEGHPVPETFLEQLGWPFIQKSEDEDSSTKEDVS